MRQHGRGGPWPNTPNILFKDFINIHIIITLTEIHRPMAQKNAPARKRRGLWPNTPNILFKDFINIHIIITLTEIHRPMAQKMRRSNTKRKRKGLWPKTPNILFKDYINLQYFNYYINGNTQAHGPKKCASQLHNGKGKACT